MPSALVDTGLLRDYLRGDTRARDALTPYAHRSISVVTWLDVMADSPPAVMADTRAFLRSFERLSVSEGIADEALRLLQQCPGLERQRATVWASAVVNQLPLLTSDPRGLPSGDPRVVLAYTGSRA